MSGKGTQTEPFLLSPTEYQWMLATLLDYEAAYDQASDDRKMAVRERAREKLMAAGYFENCCVRIA